MIDDMKCIRCRVSLTDWSLMTHEAIAFVGIIIKESPIDITLSKIVPPGSTIHVYLCKQCVHQITIAYLDNKGFRIFP